MRKTFLSCRMFFFCTDKRVTVKRRWCFSGFVRTLSCTWECMSCGRLRDIKKNNRIFVPRSRWAMHGKGEHEDGELICLLVEQNTIHYWVGTVKLKCIAGTKNVSFPFAFTHVKRMFLFGVLLRFFLKRFFTSAHPDSQNFLAVWLCDGWGEVGEEGEKQGLAFHHSLPLAWRSSGAAQGIQSSWPIDSLAEPFSSVPDVVVVHVLIMLTSAY